MCAVRRLMRTHLMLNPGTEHFSAPHAVQHVICRKATLADADEQRFSSFLLESFDSCWRSRASLQATVWTVCSLMADRRDCTRNGVTAPCAELLRSSNVQAASAAALSGLRMRATRALRHTSNREREDSGPRRFTASAEERLLFLVPTWQWLRAAGSHERVWNTPANWSPCQRLQ